MSTAESGTGRAAGRAAGFTLLEILLVIALIALVGTLLVVGGASAFGGGGKSPEDVFWEAVEAARKSALLGHDEVRLRFDAETKRFVAASTQAERSFPVEATADLAVDLLSAQRSGNTVLIGGQLLETGPLPFVRFFDDGTCTPFRVQIRQGDQARILEVDPWTCAPVLRAGGES